MTKEEWSFKSYCQENKEEDRSRGRGGGKREEQRKLKKRVKEKEKRVSNYHLLPLLFQALMHSEGLVLT